MRASANWTTRGGGPASGILRSRAAQSSQRRHAGISGGEEWPGRHDRKHHRRCSSAAYAGYANSSTARCRKCGSPRGRIRGAASAWRSSSRRCRSTLRWTRRIAAFSSASSAWTQAARRRRPASVCVRHIQCAAERVQVHAALGPVRLRTAPRRLTSRSKSRISAAACSRERRKRSSGPSNSGALIARAWDWAWRSAARPSKRTAARLPCETFPERAAFVVRCRWPPVSSPRDGEAGNEHPSCVGAAGDTRSPCFS